MAAAQSWLALLLLCSASCSVQICLATDGGPSSTELAGHVTAPEAEKLLINASKGGGPLGVALPVAAVEALAGAVPAAEAAAVAPSATAAVRAAIATGITSVALPAGRPAGGQPALQPTECAVPSVTDPSFSSTTVAYMASEMRQRMSQECTSVVMTTLVACIPDMSLAQGCCTTYCARGMRQVGC